MKQQFVIPRLSADEVTCAVVTFENPTKPISQDEFLQILKNVTTDWICETEEGNEIWEQSSRDFNIGDLATHGIPNFIHDHLREAYHFSNLTVECFVHCETWGNWTYDTVLVNDLTMGE